MFNFGILLLERWSCMCVCTDSYVFVLIGEEYEERKEDPQREGHVWNCFLSSQ